MLDLSCGDGELLLRLGKQRGVLGYDIDASWQVVASCISKGLSVLHLDAECALNQFPG